MAPFLVITLLLALGAGIVAWCVTGPAYQGPPLIKPRQRRSAQNRPALDAPPSDAEPVIAALEPTPVSLAVAPKEAQP